jgi:LPS O-antigen subunit length determinant protein (WzzB/FepE family)
MIFDLTPNSLSMRILEAYISLKAKKEGMDPKDYLNVDYSRYTNYNLACLLDKYFRYGDQEIESKELERRLEDSIRNYENGELFRIYQDPKTRPKLVAFLNIVKDFKPKVVEDVLLILNQKGYQNIKLASDDQMSEDPMLREIDESIMKQVWNGINKLYEAGTFK